MLLNLNDSIQPNDLKRATNDTTKEIQQTLCKGSLILLHYVYSGKPNRLFCCHSQNVKHYFIVLSAWAFHRVSPWKKTFRLKKKKKKKWTLPFYCVSTCSCHRTWRTRDHRGPRQRTPTVWRTTSFTATASMHTSTSPQTITPPLLPLPPQTEPTVCALGSPGAAWQRMGAERGARQGPFVWRPSCDEDSGGPTESEGDAEWREQ